MILHYSFDHSASAAIAAGAVYPNSTNRFYRTGWSSYMNNGKDPACIAIAALRYGAQGQYFLLLATAESPQVVHKKLEELKGQFGIISGPVAQPPSGLEAELAVELVALQAQFERLKNVALVTR